MGISVNKEKCVGCGACYRSCPQGAITIETVEGRKKASIDQSKCVYCGSCKSSCRFSAIDIDVQKKAFSNKEAYKGIWVYAEINNGKTDESAFELLTKARVLAKEAGEEVCCFLMGSSISSNASEAAEWADKVYAADYEELKEYRDDIYSDVMAYTLNEYKPAVVLSASTINGRAFVPRAAVKLETGLTADCVVLEMNRETKLLEQTRPAFGGNLMATILCENARPQMATVRPGVFAASKDNSRAKGEVIAVSVPKDILKSKMEIIDRENDESASVNLKEYDIIVSGGRGMMTDNGFELLKELADLMGGTVGCSRPVADAGLLDHSHLVGQTGTTVKPKMYIAVGISGSVQHLAGMEDADIIIAVNKDPNAPIFTVANYGIVADGFEFVPALIEKIKAGRK